jgi:hypothetical protein
MHKDAKCRGCGADSESQEHILEECPTIHKDGNSKVTKEELFDNMLNTEQMKDLAGKIKTIEEKITNK